MSLEKPSYCPDAIATDSGWVNPRNGELLVSIRNLPEKIKNLQHKKIEVVTVVAETTKEQVDKNFEIGKSQDMTVLQISDGVVIEDQPKKRAGRPKKIAS